MDRDCPKRQPSKCPPAGRGRERQRGDGLSGPGVGDGQASPDGQAGVALEAPPGGGTPGTGPDLSLIDAGGGPAMLRAMNRDARQRPGIYADPRWDRFVNGEPPATPAEPHPLEGSGFDWLSAEDVSRLYGDFTGETNIDGSNEEVVKYADGGDGGRRWRISADANDWRYAAPGGARSIGGKGALYSVGSSATFRMRNAADDGDETASGYLSGRASAFVLVARRRTTATSQLAYIDGSRPGRFAFLDSTRGQFQHFTSGGFQRPVNFDWGLEEAVIVVRWNESTMKMEASFNGGSWLTSSSPSDAWSAGGGIVGLITALTAVDIAVFGVHDGDKSRADLDTLADSLMSYYGIEATA